MEQQQRPDAAGHELPPQLRTPPPGGEAWPEGAGSPEDPDEPTTGEPDDPAGSLQMWAPVTMVAYFQSAEEAQACAQDSRWQGLEAAVALVSPSQRPEEVLDPGLSNGVVLGATVGATAGMLAASYFLPGLSGPLINASPLFTTLAGAGLGTFVVGLSERQGPGEPDVGRPTGVAVQVNPRQAAAAERVLRDWGPKGLQVKGR